MSVYIITGEQGEGKGIMAMVKIQEALRLGKRVVTNIDLRLEHLVPHAKIRDVIRCSDFPSAEELWALGKGFPDYNEKMFGLIVLDEVGLYLNSRNFKDAGRESFIKWLRHVRKMHWDLMLLVQSAESLDKQIRNGLAHFQVKCRAGDKMTVPFFSPIWKFFTGYTINLPKFHAGVVKRGFGPSAVKVDTWFTRGVEFYKAYDTGQIYTGLAEGVSSVLHPGRVDYMRRPTGAREMLFDAFYSARLRFPWLNGILPQWLCKVSQERCRYVDFDVSQREGLPSAKPVSNPQSFEAWALAQIPTADASASGVAPDLPEATFAPLRIAA